VHRGGNGFVVRAHHVYDDGTPEFLDISSFAPVDGDEYAGEGVELMHHREPEGALDGACDHGAVPDRWVNFGVAADEYADARGWS
jgi:hypothetical protein